MKSLCWGKETAGRVCLEEGNAPFDALLMSRLDVDVRIIELPPVAGRDVEGLIRYRLRRIYPAAPEDTAFDYRLCRNAHVRTAVVCVSRRTTLDAYRTAAGSRPLLVPSLLLLGLAPRTGRFRAWICHEAWQESLLFDDGVLVSSAVRRGRCGRNAPIPRNDGEESLVVASSSLLASISVALEVRKVSIEHLAEHGLRHLQSFAPAARESAIPPSIRLALLAAVTAVLAVALLYKTAGAAAHRANELKEHLTSVESENRRALALQEDLDRLRSDVAALESRKPRDLYLLFAELGAIVGGTARIRGAAVNGDAFRIEAEGLGSLKLMESLRRRPGFSELTLSQVVTDQSTGRERFSISGVFHGR